MKSLPPDPPEPCTTTTAKSPIPGLTVPGRPSLAERVLDLIAFLALLIITGLLYGLIGPSAGMVTGTAVVLYSTYRGGNPTPPSGPPGGTGGETTR
ncbi:hypothetical protein [Actinacidiphila paucisporea]|uniref:Uncharacterized protein n=1 Tax=Actinacidiphila paucisporea TaxID=310782 RepID=A0A1M7PY19_9ACTN|nr:hypothetical protein [Actinacidiphila paucisporea]SHN22631.1 hypothetical protein SAMN05216499_12724 [Actinacidiphila paucisporea]